MICIVCQEHYVDDGSGSPYCGNNCLGMDIARRHGQTFEEYFGIPPIATWQPMTELASATLGDDLFHAVAMQMVDSAFARAFPPDASAAAWGHPAWNDGAEWGW